MQVYRLGIVKCIFPFFENVQFLASSHFKHIEQTYQPYIYQKTRIFVFGDVFEILRFSFLALSIHLLTHLEENLSLGTIRWHILGHCHENHPSIYKNIYIYIYIYIYINVVAKPPFGF